MDALKRFEFLALYAPYFVIVTPTVARKRVFWKEPPFLMINSSITIWCADTFKAFDIIWRAWKKQNKCTIVSVSLSEKEHKGSSGIPLIFMKRPVTSIMLWWYDQNLMDFVAPTTSLIDSPAIAKVFQPFMDSGLIILSWARNKLYDSLPFFVSHKWDTP